MCDDVMIIKMVELLFFLKYKKDDIQTFMWIKEVMSVNYVYGDLV